MRMIDPTMNLSSDQPPIYRPRTPNQEERKVGYEARAKRDHDRLIEMGGRPTRPVRLQPTWNATYKDGLIYLIDNEGELKCTLSVDIDPMHHHWSGEAAHFRRELENWQGFREYQQSVRHLDRLETELELDNTDAGLINALTRLSDWEEFEVFQDLILVDALDFEDRCRLDFLEITSWEVSTEHQPISSVAHAAIDPWLRVFDRSQEEVGAAKNQLKWIKGQWPKAVAESLHSISKTPELQQDLEAKFRKQTYAAFSAIQKLGGRPSHAVSPPDKSMNDLQRILFWSSETSKYKEELLDWKMFLKWRRHNLGDKPTTQRQEYRCPEFRSAVDFFAEFEKFRQFQYNVALTWLKCWQRIVRWYEEETETPHPAITPGYLEDYADGARSHVRDSEQKLADAALRLQNSMQEHAHALSEQGQTSGCDTKKFFPQKPFPPTPPLSGSESPESSRYSSSPPQFSLSSPSPPSSQSSQSRPSPQSLQSPESLSKDRRPSNKSSSAEKCHRRSKKEKARKRGAKMGNTNIKQQPLPMFSFDPTEVKRDGDIEMSEILEGPGLAEAIEELNEPESEDTVMSDVEDSPSQTLSSSSKSHPWPTTNTHLGKLPSPSAGGPTSRKTRSAKKLGQALSDKVTKNKNVRKKPTTKIKQFTEQQTMALLNAASTNLPSTDPTSPSAIPLRRSERLKKKAVASAVITPPHFNAVEIPRPPRQRKPRLQPNAL